MRKLNPYNNKNMLPHDSEMFFGRADEMRRVEAMLRSDNPQCVSIIGEAADRQVFAGKPGLSPAAGGGEGGAGVSGLRRA